MSNDLLTRIEEVERLEKEWLAADEDYYRKQRVASEVIPEYHTSLAKFHDWKDAVCELYPDLVTAYRALLAASTAQQERIKRLEEQLVTAEAANAALEYQLNSADAARKVAVAKLAEIRETCVGEEHFIACEILSIIEKE